MKEFTGKKITKEVVKKMKFTQRIESSGSEQSDEEIYQKFKVKN